MHASCSLCELLGGLCGLKGALTFAGDRLTLLTQPPHFGFKQASMKFKNYVIELSLVVIGILIAISVDNVREDIKNNSSARSLLKVITEDLTFDIDTLTTQLNQDSASIRRYRRVIALLDSNQLGRVNAAIINLYYNSEYEPRLTGYKMLTNSNLFMQVDVDLMERLTNYYETSTNDLKSWSRKDDLIASKMVDFLIKNQNNFSARAIENKMLVGELKQLVISKEFLLSNEMIRKRVLLTRARKLRAQLEARL